MMIPGVAGESMALMAASQIAGGRILSADSTLVTYYLADLQFEHLGDRGFTHNSLVKWLFPPADRNVIATQSAALFTDELLSHVQRENAGHPQAVEVKGDVADTPLRCEVARLSQILGRHNLPVEGYARGNHSSGNLFGVINLASPWYEAIRRLPIIGRFALDEQLEGAAGDPGEILTQSATIDVMHRMISNNREDVPGPKRITTAVHAADSDSYQLVADSERVAFTPENLDLNFQTFWRPTKGTKAGLPRETRLWECIINYDIADEMQTLRGTHVNPFYLQASETARFLGSDGNDYPVYTISIDGMDHRNLLSAVGGGVSEFQVRLIETFVEERLRENPRARFKISSHFAANELIGVPWYLPWRRWRTGKARKMFANLLRREEIILYSFGHTHERKVADLNKELKLGRKTPLIEINVPSLIDYRPSVERHNGDYHDARAIVVEKMKLEERPEGRRLVIDLEYRGLDAMDIREGKTEAVRDALETYAQDHGYIRARETEKMLRNQHLIGWCKSHVKRLGEFAWFGGLNLFYNPRRFFEYWRDLSITQYLFDNLTVISTVNMFNEAYHLLPFLESVAHFIGEEEDGTQLAIRAQLLGLRTALLEDYTVRHHKFVEALAHGSRPARLKAYNDLFSRTRAYRLSDLLTKLRPEGEARAFALLAGLEASQQEFILDKRKPTEVPNKVPTIEIPV